jgi:hypothetical protein
MKTTGSTAPVIIKLTRTSAGTLIHGEVNLEAIVANTKAMNTTAANSPRRKTKVAHCIQALSSAIVFCSSESFIVPPDDFVSGFHSERFTEH